MQAQIVSIGVGFAPDPISINVGDTVVWTHVDGAAAIPHTVTANNGEFDSGSAPADWMFQGDSFANTFDTPGTFSYFCVVHPNMQGQVVVN